MSAVVHIPVDAIETVSTLYQAFDGGGSLTVGSTYLYGGNQDEAFIDWAYDLIVANWGADRAHIQLSEPFRIREGDDTSVIDVRNTYEGRLIGYLKVKIVRRLADVSTERWAA